MSDYNDLLLKKNAYHADEIQTPPQQNIARHLAESETDFSNSAVNSVSNAGAENVLDVLDRITGLEKLLQTTNEPATMVREELHDYLKFNPPNYQNAYFNFEQNLHYETQNYNQNHNASFYQQQQQQPQRQEHYLQPQQQEHYYQQRNDSQQQNNVKKKQKK
ncbi:hypothetical protein [Lambdina fiscellaria nucleopolyhedrovirus]|uniref:Uncharacterized protein n=1 Tax=Lambdina fiscellaria nucleopolyhedrovirus TaxID=1642929 RepID=A0A0E3Z649_9ABAC|nr:hypothetical protein [Lambdina fiscellaria nucleopolyhedrovirus]AKC91757.1 hypothetical protein [Lambdina fiscellaria nucleopolyhedrovirus]